MAPTPPDGPRPPSAPSSSASHKPSTSWTSVAQQEEAEAIATASKLAQTHAKPFSTPANFKAPSLGEQFSYAARRHPYARLGYAAVFLTGGGVWWLASSSSGSSGEGEKEKETKTKT